MKDYLAEVAWLAAIAVGILAAVVLWLIPLAFLVRWLNHSGAAWPVPLALTGAWTLLGLAAVVVGLRRIRDGR